MARKGFFIDLDTPEHRATIDLMIAAREKAGLSKRQLSAALDRSNSFIWKLEARKIRLDILEFLEIAKIICPNPQELFDAIDDIVSAKFPYPRPLHVPDR